MKIGHLLCARHYPQHAHVGYFVLCEPSCGQGKGEEQQEEEGVEERINLPQ